MNLLTQSLLKELLGEQKTVAIYGGGFKPPTKGHFHVAELTLEKFPEIDELKIFVGGGVRDGITQDESIKIWNIYKNYLSPKVDVEASVAPVKSILGYAKENPDTKVYWILGARDGDEGDLADIENRTKSISKYPNLEVKVITTSGGVSGTKTRQAIRDNNKEQFFHMIPDVNNTEKEEIWNMISPIIKEGIVDNMKIKIKDFMSAVKQEGQETKEVVGLLIHAAQGKIKLNDEQKEYIGNQLKDILKIIGLTAIAVLPGGSIAAVLLKVFKQTHLITPSSMMNEVGEANLKPYKWQELDMNGYVVFARFVTDSETQYDVNLTVTNYVDDDFNNLKALEVEFIAKPKGAEGSSAKIVVNKGELYKVMSTITAIIKHYIKKFKAKAIMYSPSKKSDEEDFGTQRDNLYKAFISKALPGVKFEKNSNFITAILPDTINELVTDTEVICDNCGWEWKIEDGGDDLYTCHKCGHDNNPDLNEGKQVGLLYHYTSTNGLKGILQSNRINASEENYLGNELYYISFTRNKNFHKKGSKFGVQTEYRITLYGDKLSNKYKIRPFAYRPGWDIENSWELDWLDDEPESVRRDFFNATGDYDEQEERIFFKNKNGSIDNIKNYILAVDKVEDLQEGRKKKPDPKKGTGKKPEGSSRRLYTDEDPKDTVKIKFKTKEDIVDTLNKESFKSKPHARKSQIINVIHQRVRAAYSKAKDPEVKSRLKRALDYIEKRKEMSKKKTERLRKMKEASDPQAGTALPYGLGFAPIKESYQFKVSDKNYDEEDNSLISVDYNFSTPDNDYRVEFNSGEYNPESKKFDVSFGLDKGYGFKLDTFQMTGEGNALSILKTIIDIIKDFTNRFEVNKLVINPTSEKRGKIYSMILKSLSPDILSKVELVNENDIFGLNELAKDFVKEVFDKAWNLQEGMLSLSKYMIDNGMNIKPLPKIKVIKDDEENASNLLGKTAYYNPVEKSITLFTMNRHPKDILRSFAHEMIHHEQNLNGKLNNITTQNTNEDGDLPEIEREAYEKGNMMLRNWEDSIKNV